MRKRAFEPSSHRSALKSQTTWNYMTHYKTSRKKNKRESLEKCLTIFIPQMKRRLLRATKGDDQYSCWQMIIVGRKVWGDVLTDQIELAVLTVRLWQPLAQRYHSSVQSLRNKIEGHLWWERNKEHRKWITESSKIHSLASCDFNISKFQSSC